MLVVCDGDGEALRLYGATAAGFERGPVLGRNNLWALVSAAPRHVGEREEPVVGDPAACGARLDVVAEIAYLLWGQPHSR